MAWLVFLAALGAPPEGGARCPTFFAGRTIADLGTGEVTAAPCVAAPKPVATAELCKAPSVTVGERSFVVQCTPDPKTHWLKAGTVVSLVSEQTTLTVGTIGPCEFAGLAVLPSAAGTLDVQLTCGLYLD